MLHELQLYSRMAAEIVRSSRQQLPADPQEYVRLGVRNRERAFLDTVEQTLFLRAGHPFRAILDAAGCAFGDLEGAVRRNGLDHTLRVLRDQGVYLSHDEWKGKTPIVRAGREIPATPGSFRNPLVTACMETSSSGSTGRPIASSRSSAYIAHAAVYHMLDALEFGGERRIWIDLKPILPYPGGLSSVLRGRRTGTPVERWFSAGAPFRSHGHYRMVTRFMVGVGNLCGARAPYPDYLPHNDYSRVAEYAARRRAEGFIPIVHGFASPLVRVAASALEKGIDIAGAIFLCGGEALSPAKLEVFERAGARAYSRYTVSEVGNLGFACASMRGSCVHLFEDSVAAIGVPRQVSYADDSEMNSLHFTPLLPHAPNIVINLEIDDDGILGTADCRCAYARAGLNRSISHINSFGKATPQGITWHRTDLAQIVERILPARFGGGPGDYQLMEYEAANGQTQFRLLVSPRVGRTDSEPIRRGFLDLLRPQFGGALTTREWSFSDGFEVAFSEPVATITGKVHPVRLLGAYSRQRQGRQSAHAAG